MLGENRNVLGLLNRKSARIPTETYKSTTQHTTGSISHPRQCLFTRTTPRIRGLNHVGHWLFSLNSNPFLFIPLLWKHSVLSTALHLFHFEWILPCYFFLPPTHFSVILPMSFIIIFSPSLSCFIGSPLLVQFLLLFLIFLYNTYLSTLCTYHKNFSFSCHHLSMATREGSVHVWRYADLSMWGLCLHRQKDSQTHSKCDQGMM